MVELVDTADLKSSGPKGPYEFESRCRYNVMAPRRGLNEWDISKLKRQVEQHIECSAFPNPWQVKSGILEDGKEKSSFFKIF